MAANATFRHDRAQATGVLVVNLGTPTAPTAGAVRRYLREFLSDRRVIDLPRLLWLPILYGPISLLRPAKVARNYAKVWLDGGSPLLVHSQGIADSLATNLHRRGAPVHVELAMTYGQPSVAEALSRLEQANVRRLLVLPLYPQYSGTTTAAVVDAVMQALSDRPWLPELRVVNDYFDHPGYIEALANSVRQYQQRHGQPDRLLFSFHGLPERYWHAGDPYPCQCRVTARFVAEALDLAETDYQVAFQSRFGKAKWIEPYTDQTLDELARNGVRHVQVICPGFAADCLETLEEIEIQNRELFLAAGAERLEYIPALNAQKDHIDALVDIITANGANWPEFSPTYDAGAARQEAEASARRATSQGADS